MFENFWKFNLIQRIDHFFYSWFHRLRLECVLNIHFGIQAVGHWIEAIENIQIHRFCYLDDNHNNNNVKNNNDNRKYFSCHPSKTAHFYRHYALRKVHLIIYWMQIAKFISSIQFISIRYASCIISWVMISWVMIIKVIWLWYNIFFLKCPRCLHFVSKYRLTVSVFFIILSFLNFLYIFIYFLVYSLWKIFFFLSAFEIQIMVMSFY